MMVVITFRRTTELGVAMVTQKSFKKDICSLEIYVRDLSPLAQLSAHMAKLLCSQP
jgi:hypothetical protein